MKHKNNIQLNIEETALFVILDSIHYDKTLNYHDLFLLWDKEFEKVQIPIYIVFPDSENSIQKLKNSYHSNIHYISNIEWIQKLDCIQDKLVFGKKYTMILPKMYILHNHFLIEEQKRINNKTIKSLYIKSIELKFEIFLKKIKNSVDIPNILW